MHLEGLDVERFVLVDVVSVFRSRSNSCSTAKLRGCFQLTVA